MGLIPIVAEDGDFIPGRDVVEKEIREKKDEEEIVALSRQKRVVCSRWRMDHYPPGKPFEQDP